jgi:hypothetical protein
MPSKQKLKRKNTFTLSSHKLPLADERCIFAEEKKKS